MGDYYVGEKYGNSCKIDIKADFRNLEDAKKARDTMQSLYSSKLIILEEIK